MAYRYGFCASILPIKSTMIAYTGLMKLRDFDISKSSSAMVAPIEIYAKCVRPCTTAIIRSCSIAVVTSICAPAFSYRERMTAVQCPHLASTGTMITVCPCRSGIVGPNIGCVPSNSTPSGAYCCIALTGPVLTEVISINRLPFFISGAIRAITCSVRLIGTDIITASDKEISLSRSSAKCTSSSNAISFLALAPHTVTSHP
jgi:hypothetical protein